MGVVQGIIQLPKEVRRSYRVTALSYFWCSAFVDYSVQAAL
jgi:hypothetical protein